MNEKELREKLASAIHNAQITIDDDCEDCRENVDRLKHYFMGIVLNHGA